jgi:hypothetical protein
MISNCLIKKTAATRSSLQHQKQLFLAGARLPQSAADSTGVAGTILKGFLADAAAVRRTVPSPSQSRSPIFAQDIPCDRRAEILAESTTTRGRTRDFPFARAFLKPARTRSTISDRSNSATAPRTVKTIFPVGVEVSTCSDRLTNSIPRDLKVSSARRRWETERANRSNVQTTTASNRRHEREGWSTGGTQRQAGGLARRSIDARNFWRF